MVRALTLAQRALVEATRQRSTFLARGALIAVLIVVVWSLEQVAANTATLTGVFLLRAVAWCDFILISGVAGSYFAGVITEEKELMTLGLLRLAGFTPASLLLGKSIGALVHVLLLLVVQVPFCMLAVTFGGVTTAQITATFVMLLGYTLFAFAVALFCSVVRQRTAAAAAMTTSMLVLYHVVPLVGIGLVYFQIGPQAAGSTLLLPLFGGWWESTVLAGLWQATAVTGSFGGTDFVQRTLASVAVGAVLLVLAWLLFEPCNRNELPAAPPRPGWLLPQVRRRSRRITGHPLLWKDFQFHSGGRAGLLFRYLVYAAFVAVVAFIGREGWERDGLGEFLLGAMLFAVVLELGIQAGRFLQEEAEGKTLGSLVALPRPLAATILCKALGAAALAIPAFSFWLLGALLAPASMVRFCRGVVTEPGGWLAVAVVLAGLHLTVFYSLRFRRGALGLAILTVFAFFLGISAFSLGGFGDATAVLGAVLLVGACAVLQVAIAGRVRQLAAEG